MTNLQKMGFKKRIVTPDGYIIPLVIQGGLPYMPMSKPTDADLDNLPHIFFTSDMPWDPTVVDNILDEEYIFEDENKVDDIYKVR